MQPYPGKLAEQERVLNYYVSWVRRVIKNCFGILAARGTIFLTPIEASVVNAERYTLTCIALRNCLRQTNNPPYCPNSFVDCKDSTGDIKKGEWRKIVTERNGALANLPNARGSRQKNDAVEMCCCLMRCLNGEGRVDWQLNHVMPTQEHNYLLPKNSYVQSITKNQLFDVFMFMHFLRESYGHGSFNEMLGRFVLVLPQDWRWCLNRKLLCKCCSIIVFLLFEKEIIDFKFDFPLLLRG